MQITQAPRRNGNPPAHTPRRPCRRRASQNQALQVTHVAPTPGNVATCHSLAVPRTLLWRRNDQAAPPARPPLRSTSTSIVARASSGSSRRCSSRSSRSSRSSHTSRISRSSRNSRHSRNSRSSRSTSISTSISTSTHHRRRRLRMPEAAASSQMTLLEQIGTAGAITAAGARLSR
jgi:hypothetical protein